MAADTRDINLTLDLALKVGEVLLSSGAGAADVTATMLSVTYALGLRQCDVDVTFTSLAISYQAEADEAAVVAMRQVRHRGIDYDDLTKVDHLVRDLLDERIDRDEARRQLAQVVSSGHKLPRWAVTVGWGAMCSGASLLLGGGLIVMAIAFGAAMGIDRIQQSMSRRRMPAFYQQVAGGMFATLCAIGAAALDLPIDPSLVITANIIMLLAGVGFMGAIQDALTGFYVTSGARILEAILATAGIIAGVSGGLGIGAALGVEMGRLKPGAVGLLDTPMMALGAAICAAGFAFASYAPARILAPIAAISAVAIVIYVGVDLQGLGRAWGSAWAALFIGLVSFSVSGRMRVPALVVVVSAIVPMLPGLSIYVGLSKLADGNSDGMIQMMTAAAVAISLASGVILGEYIAQPLKREVRKLESRLSGPRLVGPFRARVARKDR